MTYDACLTKIQYLFLTVFLHTYITVKEIEVIITAITSLYIPTCIYDNFLYYNIIYNIK